MSRTDFNRDWEFRHRVTVFQELGGSTGDDWCLVTLPHDALIGTPRTPDAQRGETSGYFSGGSFEYRKSFNVAAGDEGRYVALEFDGVYRDAMVFVNGALVGQHAYGYSRFVVRIDPFLHFGKTNEVRVECRTHLDSRWYAGAGIHRDVRLVVAEPVHLAADGVRATTVDVDDDWATIEVAATVENLGATTRTVLVCAVLTDPDGAEVARGRVPLTLLPGESGVARQRRLVAAPRRWSVDEPNLYDVRIDLVEDERILDETSLKYGIRTIHADARRGLRINGVPVKLRGACIHSDNGPLGAAAIARADERRVGLLKAAGFNAIRSAHNPASPALLDACDRLGMLVMDEAFDCWTIGKSDFDYAFDFPGWWERDLAAMVAKDANHPSVIMYSIGNEIPETGDRFGGRLSRLMAEKLRELDPSRLVTNGINGMVSVLDMVLAMRAQTGASRKQSAGGVNELMAGFRTMMDRVQTAPQVTERTEESFAVLDIAGMNYGDGRYELDRDLFPDRVIVGAETWPTVIDHNWDLVMANPHVIGDFTWTGWDYLGETGIGLVQYETGDGPEEASFSGGYPGLTAWCGDIDITGHRRPVSYYREVVFGLRKEPYLAVQPPDRHDATIVVATPWAWSDTVASWSWAGFEGRPIRVEVYAAADEVELYLDGTPVGRARVGAERKFQADFELTYHPGELTAVAYSDGVESGRTSLASAGADLRLSVTPDRTELTDTTADLAYVSIELTDGAGTVKTTADRPVTVNIDGPAILQGFASANPVTEEGLTSSTHTSYHGRALAVVRPTGAGAVTLTATAAGCPPASTSITVNPLPDHTSNEGDQQ